VTIAVVGVQVPSSAPRRGRPTRGRPLAVAVARAGPGRPLPGAPAGARASVAACPCPRGHQLPLRPLPHRAARGARRRPRGLRRRPPGGGGRGAHRGGEERDRGHARPRGALGLPAHRPEGAAGPVPARLRRPRHAEGARQLPLRGRAHPRRRRPLPRRPHLPGVRRLRLLPGQGPRARGAAGAAELRLLPARAQLRRRLPPPRAARARRGPQRRGDADGLRAGAGQRRPAGPRRGRPAAARVPGDRGAVRVRRGPAAAAGHRARELDAVLGVGALPPDVELDAAAGAAVARRRRAAPRLARRHARRRRRLGGRAPPRRQGAAASFKPVAVAPFADELLFDHAERALLLSATVLDPVTFLRGLGVDPEEAAVVQVASTFPPERRPLVLRPGGAPHAPPPRPRPAEAGAEVAEIMRDHETEKGVVHAHSYRIAAAVLRACRRPARAGGHPPRRRRAARRRSRRT
jgi:hypothetical protein